LANLITIDGVQIYPGDLVLGDADGVVIVAREHAGDVLSRAQSREASEQDMKQRVQSGETTWNILSLDKALIRPQADDHQSRAGKER
jgi:4-hydroxy-4-methyl-2-oxoglutarate aldolase